MEQKIKFITEKQKGWGKKLELPLPEHLSEEMVEGFLLSKVRRTTCPVLRNASTTSWLV